MQYFLRYSSPLGEILLAADEIGITGLWFQGQKYFPHFLAGQAAEQNTPVLAQAVRWLDCYFSGGEPAFLPPVHLQGTSFQISVWQALQKIPYGQTATYGQIAKLLGIPSAQAVGGAVGRNPISILVPCHRVIGSSGNLTGYAGGLDRKRALLQLEGRGINNSEEPNG